MDSSYFLVGKVSVPKVHVERGKIILDADSPFVGADGLGILLRSYQTVPMLFTGIGVARVQLWPTFRSTSSRGPTPPGCAA